MKLVLEIELNHDAMKDYGHLAVVAQKLMREFDELEDARHEPAYDDFGVIRDSNYNAVGNWRIK